MPSILEWNMDQLLLCLVRARYHAEELEAATRLARDYDVDWQEFVRQTALHGVAPLIHETLRDQSSVLPSWVDEKLRSSYYATATRNALLYNDLAALLQAFDEADMPVVLLKGAALAQGVYGNIALRPMSDLDVLVRNEMMANAEALLSNRGYKVLEGSDTHLRHMTLRHPQSLSGTHIEVHRHIVSSAYYRSAIPEEWLWRDSGAMIVNGLPALTLSPEATIVHCCLHFLDHIGIRGVLLWLCDIAEVVRQKNVDWDALASAVAEYKVTLPVTTLLGICRDTLGVAPPVPILNGLLATSPSFVERRAFQLCLSGARSTASKTLFDFLASPGVKARFTLLSARLFPPREYMLARYRVRRAAILPLYYLRMITSAAFNGLRALRPTDRR